MNNQKKGGCGQIIGILVLVSTLGGFWIKGQVDKERENKCARILEKPLPPFDCEAWIESHAPTIYADGSRDTYFSTSCADADRLHQRLEASIEACRKDPKSGGIY